MDNRTIPKRNTDRYRVRSYCHGLRITPEPEDVSDNLSIPLKYVLKDMAYFKYLDPHCPTGVDKFIK